MLLASGEGDREAELSAIIARETGDKKRQATVDLARLYIYSGDKRADTGYRLLQPLIKEGDQVSVLIEVNGPGGYYCEVMRIFIVGRKPTQAMAPSRTAGPDFRCINRSIRRATTRAKR